MTWFDVGLLVAAIMAGATASVVGFGIGSLLTPILAARYGTPAAIAIVVVPHAVATALRCWRLRAAIDRGVLFRFGLLSAAGGLGGAMLYTSLDASALTRILGGLLLLTALARLLGWTERWHPEGAAVFMLGLGSGFFGGVAGNQGGLRAAAMTAFRLPPAAFVATATAIGLAVDAVRAPIYVWSAGSAIAARWVPAGIATVGVVAGTLLGERALLGIPPARFGNLVAGAIGALGVWLLVKTV